MKNQNHHASKDRRLHRRGSLLRALCFIAAAIMLMSGLTGCNGFLIEAGKFGNQASVHLNAVNTQALPLTTADAKTYDGKSLYCTADDFVALRESASSSSKELAKIPHGEIMTYLNKQTGHWYYVQYKYKKGYVYDKYVSFDKGAVDADSTSSNTLYCTADDYVSLRAKASSSSTELTRIPRGSKMTDLNKKSGKWYYVQYGSKKGYVYSSYVSTKNPNASSSSSRSGSKSGTSSSSGKSSSTGSSGKSGTYSSYVPDISTPSYKGTRVCKVCNGTGRVKCDSCHGEGRFKHTHHSPSFSGGTKTYYTYTTCVRCDGKKKIKCNVCNGKGRY